MTESPPPESTGIESKRPWHRFSLAGFLVFILGVGAGLARARLKGGDWPNPLFTTFAVWFVVSMVEAIVRESHDRSPKRPYSLRIAGPAFAGLLIGLAGILYLDKQSHWLRPAWSDSFPFLAVSSAITFLFYTGIICGYADALQPGPPPAKPGKGRWLISGATWLVAGAWLSLVLWSTCVVAALVHTGIQGTRLNQPYRRTGVEIYSFPNQEPLTQQFLAGAVAAVVLAVTAGALVVTISEAWSHRPPSRTILFLGWFAVILADSFLLGWCYWVLLPEWSPIITPFLFAEPYGLGLAALLLAIVSTLFAVRTAVEFVAAPPDPSSVIAAEPPLLHRRLAVMLVFLAAVVWETIHSSDYGWALLADNLDSTWGWIKAAVAVHIVEPDYLMKVAAFVCVLVSLQRWWRPRVGARMAVEFRRTKFLGLWCMWFATGLVAIPAFAWFGVSLMFW